MSWLVGKVKGSLLYCALKVAVPIIRGGRLAERRGCIVLFLPAPLFRASFFVLLRLFFFFGLLAERMSGLGFLYFFIIFFV